MPRGNGARQQFRLGRVVLFKRRQVSGGKGFVIETNLLGPQPGGTRSPYNLVKVRLALVWFS